ncbi:hypothetical protein Tco_0145055 [Tanacetum coccineum]
MAEVVGNLKEDLGEMLEVEVVMVEEEVEGLLVCQREFEERAGGGEVKGGGVDFGVSRTLLGVIPGDIMGESGGEAFRVDGGAD